MCRDMRGIVIAGTHSLKHEDGLPFDKTPLTIGEARREIIKTMRDTHA